MFIRVCAYIYPCYEFIVIYTVGYEIVTLMGLVSVRDLVIFLSVPRRRETRLCRTVARGPVWPVVRGRCRSPSAEPSSSRLFFVYPASGGPTAARTLDVAPRLGVSKVRNSMLSMRARRQTANHSPSPRSVAYLIRRCRGRPSDGPGNHPVARKSQLRYGHSPGE